MLNPNLRNPPYWAVALFESMEALREGQEQIMALVQVDQTDLDTLATDIGTIGDALSAEISKLQVGATPLPAASLKGLQDVEAKLKGLEPPVVTPTPAPTPTPTTPPAGGGTTPPAGGATPPPTAGGTTPPPATP